MNEYHSVEAADGGHDGRAIRFTGNWREYLPIAAIQRPADHRHARHLSLLGGGAAAALFVVADRGHRRHARMDGHRQGDVPWLPDRHRWCCCPSSCSSNSPFPALIARGMEVAAGVLFILFYVALHLSGRRRALPGAALPPVAHLVARDPRRQRRARLELWRRISWPPRAQRDDPVHPFPVGDDAAVEQPLERDELRPASLSRRRSTPMGSSVAGPAFTSSRWRCCWCRRDCVPRRSAAMAPTAGGGPWRSRHCQS